MDENISIPPVAEDPVTPLEFLETVYSCNELPLSVRMRAAIAAAKFRHPQLAAIATFNGPDDLGTRLDRAIERRQALIEARSSGTLLELAKAEFKELKKEEPEGSSVRRL